MIDLNELKKLAESATPGPWTTGTTGRQAIHPNLPAMFEAAVHVGNESDRGNCLAIVGLGGPGATSSAYEMVTDNAAFIAAANPAAILELIALASAAQDSAPAELPPLDIKTWQERLREKFPETADRNFFAVGHLEHAMESEIADLRAALSRPVVAQDWKSQVNEWMGEFDVVLKEHAYKALLAAAPASPQPVAKVLTAWEYFFIHEGTTAAAPMEIGPCITYDKEQAFGIGCIKQREVSILAASTPTTLTEKKIHVTPFPDGTTGSFYCDERTDRSSKYFATPREAIDAAIRAASKTTPSSGNDQEV
jgi:hypothetical protein